MASHGSGQGSARIVDFGKHDAILARVRLEAEEAVHREPDLGAFMFANVLNHDMLEGIVVHRVAVRLENRDLPSDLIRQIYMDMLSQDPAIGEAFRADAMAVFDRDPAGTRRFVAACFSAPAPKCSAISKSDIARGSPRALSCCRPCRIIRRLPAFPPASSARQAAPSRRAAWTRLSPPSRLRRRSELHPFDCVSRGSGLPRRCAH